MAYNASIAEQFEVIQRWLTGGNSSGLSSAQSDPFVGVPEVGQRRTFRFTLDDKVVRVDLGDQPLVDLEWGLYAFVPSIKALQSIDKLSVHRSVRRRRHHLTSIRPIKKDGGLCSKASAHEIEPGLRCALKVA